MHAHRLDAYIIPSSDPHQGEYLADHWKSRAWASGFTGSAGTLVVTHDHAGIWTDSRYFLQAEKELAGSGIVLHKLGVPHTSEHLQWMTDHLPAGTTVGLDGRLFSLAQVRRLAQHFSGKNINLQAGADLLPLVWPDRPPMPLDPIFEHPQALAGEGRWAKLERVREKMNGTDFYLVSTLDDVCWLLNLRGNDMACNPVFYAFVVVGQSAAWLFVDSAKLPEPLKALLNQDGVIVKPYAALEDFLKKLPEGSTISVDPVTTSSHAHGAIPQGSVKEGGNIVAALKTIKNPTEVQHLKQAMVKDGVALTRLFRWLEQTLAERPVPEAEVADVLKGFRSSQDQYVGESFDAIVGYNGNGAIVHYRPTHEDCAEINPTGILLLDSGGQYLDGTTDITRTVALSQPTAEQVQDFTLVLKGHIALAKAKFPRGTTGIQLDTLARADLWQHQLNFGHGTGHGVGFFLCVHEGPQGFSPVPSPRSQVAFEPGMLTSNEPGLYRAGKHGIRIENLVLCVEAGTSDFGQFYQFETVSLFPIDLGLIDATLLSEAEKQWLNDYHATVFNQLSPHLEPAEQEWLRSKCVGIDCLIV